MTPEQYKQQNRLGIEGDVIAKQEFERIIKEFGITDVIETGTYLGSTTKLLADHAPMVHTIESNSRHFTEAREYLTAEVFEKRNVEMHLGNSAEVLGGVIDDILAKGRGQRVFMFLDAHWEEYNPLLDELKLIAEKKIRPIIAIHDFKIPDHPELGFDTYKDIVYEWDWIKDSILSIYGEDFIRVYNSEATGAKRGIVYIYPSELKKLSDV